MELILYSFEGVVYFFELTDFLDGFRNFLVFFVTFFNLDDLNLTFEFTLFDNYEILFII